MQVKQLSQRQTVSSNPEEEKKMKAGFLHKIGGQEICDLYEDFNKLASPPMYKTQIVWHFYWKSRPTTE